MKLIENNISKDLEDKLDTIYKYIDYQWWLYRGSLSRQSLNLSYYKDWYSLYDKFLTIFNSIYESKDNKFESQIKQFYLLKNSLITEKDKLKTILYKEPYAEFETCINKLFEYIDRLVEFLRGIQDE